MTRQEKNELKADLYQLVAEHDYDVTIPALTDVLKSETRGLMEVNEDGSDRNR